MIFDTKYDANFNDDFSLVKELLPVIIVFIIVLYASKIGINDIISKCDNIPDHIQDINIELLKTE
jgi:hypothetical protein